jgi:hypothetical protein
MPCSGMLRRVALVRTGVSEELLCENESISMEYRIEDGEEWG